MRGYACFVSAACLLAFVSAAAAGPAVDAAARAEALVTEGKTTEALDAFDAAYEALWNFMPLGFRNVHLVESSAGYGIYEEQADRSFRADERMAVYVEPVGYSYAETGDGYAIDLKTSLEIRDTDGRVVAEAKDSVDRLARDPPPQPRIQYDAVLPRPLHAAGRLCGGVQGPRHPFRQDRLLRGALHDASAGLSGRNPWRLGSPRLPRRLALQTAIF